MNTNVEYRQYDLNLDRYTFTIVDSGLRIVKKGISSDTDTLIAFEDIGSTIIQEKTRKLIWLLLSLLFAGFAIMVFIKRLNGGKVGSGAELFHVSLSLIFFIVYAVTKKNVIYLAQADHTNAIAFVAAKRYQTSTNSFIKTVLEKRNQYFIKKYSALDEFLPYEQQYNNLVWLYELKLLSKNELQSKIAELDLLFNGKTHISKNNLGKIIGFRTSQIEEEEDDDDDD